MTRTYGEGCPIALSLDIVGERWALLVVRELRLGPRRYRDLQAALPGITPAVLSKRLKELEEYGVLRRRELPPPAAAKVYELTEWGAGLEPVFQALARWGVRSPVLPLTGEVSADSVMLGLRTFFAEPPATDWSATYEVTLDRDVYRLRVEAGRLTELARGPAAAVPDVVVRTTKAAWQAVLDGADPLDDAVAAGRLSVTGDVEALRRLSEAPRKIRTRPAPA
ncbi:winged helix-turn-helix transcriptional regulator [Jiangella sp. DSM 45060]|uniref:winged helix-turn-helix transcriptional regulator n=1 Tax=Jiangella sp. DSM 45060 TaxID=1798224 RepID=UPI00087A2E0D|nr:winged helix-turn-helix transcriptional regulator [Jiangella sp. DSM 45060]SDT53920.1 DNA-binding transcriptional regulator, HxlR family [Jiangella sp. DSM 45060]